MKTRKGCIVVERSGAGQNSSVPVFAEPVDPAMPNAPLLSLLRPELLDPISTNGPCGLDLEYDDRFLELERAQAGQPERVLGEHVLPAVPPDWSLARTLAAALAKQTRDLRVGVTLLRTWVHTEGVDGLIAGLVLLRTWVDHYWNDLHPAPDLGDPDPHWPRAAALQPLVHADGLPRDIEPLLRRAGPADARWPRAARELLALTQAIDRLAPELFEPRPLLTALAPWLEEGDATPDRAPRDPPPESSPLVGADIETLAEVRSWIERVDRWAAASEPDHSQELRRWQRQQAPDLERLLIALRAGRPT